MRRHNYKTIAKATEILGYTRQTLWNWRKSGIPYRTQVVIQFKTMGALQADKPSALNTKLGAKRPGKD